MFTLVFVEIMATILFFTCAFFSLKTLYNLVSGDIDRLDSLGLFIVLACLTVFVWTSLEGSILACFDRLYAIIT